MKEDKFCRNCGEDIFKSNEIIFDMQGYCPTCGVVGEYDGWCSQCGSFILEDDYSIHISKTNFKDYRSYNVTESLLHISIYVTGLALIVDVIVFIFFLAAIADTIPKVRYELED